MKTLCLVSVFAGSVGLPVVVAVAQERPRIIDMHMHAHHAPFELPGGAPGPCRPSPCQPQGHATATAVESFEKTLEAMNRYNIVKGFLSGADFDLVQRWDSQAPGRFIPSPWVMEAGKPAAEALRRDYVAGRFRGMGEIAGQLAGLAPNDPALAPYFALAAEFDVPVSIHTAGVGPQLPGFRSAAGSPLLLEDVLVKHPNLRVFVENTGYPYLDEITTMMYQYPNLYGDLSTITWVIPRAAFHAYLKALIDAGLGKRLMFGSDQMRWPEMIGKAIEAIEAADFLTAEQKRDIFYNNAARFLRLEDARQVGAHVSRWSR
jgi:predicted TIM-barrel fold metal-dependent hydrolase